MKPRLVFMGSPDFATPSLKALASQYPVVGVVTQPDRQAGRGRVITSPPVKELAIQLGIPFIQPARLRDTEAFIQLQEWRPDIIVVAAFGQILRPEVLSLPSKGCINVHASLLPRWRGAAPIPAAILHADTETGITLIQMDTGIDTGPILAQRKIPIEPDDTAATLSAKLARLGAGLLIETLPLYMNESLKPKPQTSDQATFAPMLKKEDGRIDFTKSAQQLGRMVRAFNPWPGAYTQWKDQRLTIHLAHAQKALVGNKTQPGCTLIHENLPAIMTGEGILVLDEVQPAGKKRMSGRSFLQGAREWGDGILTGKFSPDFDN